MDDALVSTLMAVGALFFCAVISIALIVNIYATLDIYSICCRKRSYITPIALVLGLIVAIQCMGPYAILLFPLPAFFGGTARLMLLLHGKNQRVSCQYFVFLHVSTFLFPLSILTSYLFYRPVSLLN